jgi:uncharacterized membrane protein YbaN (DUF454 family)
MEKAMMIDQLKKNLWVIGGTLCIALAVLGIFLPVLPTTPLLLLAAYCYGRGSKRFHHWLVNRSFFGGYIRNYQSGLGIPLAQKIWVIVILWLTIGITIAIAGLPWWLDVLLVGVAVGVTRHIVRIKTYRTESAVQEEKLKTSAK